MSSRRCSSALSMQRVELLAHARVAAVGLGQLVDRLGHLVAHRQRGLAGLLQDREDDALLLAEQGAEQVVGRDLGVAVGTGVVDGRVEGLLGLQRPAVRIERHGVGLLYG